MVVGFEDDEVDLTAEKRVPTFFAGKLKNQQRFDAAFGAAVVAMMFGAIHCIAWSFSFPTLAEKILWQLSSIPSSVSRSSMWYILWAWWP